MCRFNEGYLHNCEGDTLPFYSLLLILYQCGIAHALRNITIEKTDAYTSVDTGPVYVSSSLFPPKIPAAGLTLFTLVLFLSEIAV